MVRKPDRKAATKLSVLIVFLSFLFACGNGSSGNYNEKRELVPNPEGYKKDTFQVDTSNGHHKTDSTILINKKEDK